MRFAPLVLPLALLAATPLVTPWGRMWTMILGLFYLAKWATWFRATGMGVRSSAFRHVGYLLTWPGMNARVFLDESRRSEPPSMGE